MGPGNFQLVFHQQMMEQIHPLRGKKFHEIFPVVNIFYRGDGDNRDTMRETNLERLTGTEKRAVSPLRASANFYEKAGDAGHRALQRLEKLTWKNKYLRQITK